MRFLYPVSLFTSLERFGNGLSDIFMFKESKKTREKKTPLDFFMFESRARKSNKLSSYHF